MSSKHLDMELFKGIVLVVLAVAVVAFTLTWFFN